MMTSSQGFQNGEDQVYRADAAAGLPWRILLFSGIVFAMSIFVFFGLRFGYASYLDSRSENLDERIQELASRVSQEDQQDLISFYSQIINLRTVLDRHHFVVKTFDYLEKYVLPSVTYTGAKVSMNGTSIVLSGEANTMQDLIEQLSVFDTAPEFEGKAIIDQLSFNGERVGFGVTLQIKPESLKRL